MGVRRILALAAMLSVLLSLRLASSTVAGEPPPTPGSIAVHKFHDLDQNGVQNGDEANLAHWPMRIYRWDKGQPPVLVAEGDTDDSGEVTFGDLEPGRYEKVSNTENVELTRINLSDSHCDGGNCASTNPLALEASFACVTGPLTAMTGWQVNTTSATGDYSGVIRKDIGYADYSGTLSWVGERPTSLEVWKTAEALRTRAYDWTISKSVQPELLELARGESCDLTYTISVEREGADDTYSVQGTIYAENDIENTAHLVDVVDCVEYRDPDNPGPEPGRFTTLTCETLQTGGTIAPGATASWDYSIDFTSVPGANAYRNRAEVTISNHPSGLRTFLYRESFNLPSRPTGDEDVCATVTDLQNIPNGFSATDDYPDGGWYTCKSDTFTIEKALTNDNAGPGTYHLVNTATVVQEDSGAETSTDAAVTIAVPDPVPATLILVPDEVTNELPADTSHPFTATILDQYGDPMEGVRVSFSTDFGHFGEDGQYVKFLTDESGQATVTVVSTAAGTAHIRAWVDDGDDTYTKGELTDAPSIKTWEGEDPTSLVVTKTVEALWARSYDWSITKSVDPESLMMGLGQSSDVTYIIEVVRLTAADTYTVQGRIYAQNEVENAAHILGVVDAIEYKLPSDNPWTELISVTVADESWIPAGDLGTWNYRYPFEPVEDATYRNVAYVTLANSPDGEHTFLHREDFDLPGTPTREVDASATVTDVQDIPEGFSATDDCPTGGWETHESVTFTVEKTVTNESAGLGTYDLDNTATVREGDSDHKTSHGATVTITVGEPPELPCLHIRKILDGAFTDPYTGEDLAERTDLIRVGADWPTRFHLTIEVENCGNVDLTSVEVTDIIENWVAPRALLDYSGGSPPELRPPGEDEPGLDTIVWTIGDLPGGQSAYLKLLIETLRSANDQYAPTSPDQDIAINEGAAVHAVAPGFGTCDVTTEAITLTMRPARDEHISLITPPLPYDTPWAEATCESITASTNAGAQGADDTT